MRKAWLLFPFFLPALLLRAEEVARVRYVMGTSLKVSVEAREAPDAETAAQAALDEVERWDRLLSTYKPDSEVSRLNAAAPEGVGISSDTASAIRAAMEWAERTGGAFDPTIGSLVRAWGFDGAEPRVPSEKDLSVALSLLGAARVELSEGRARLPAKGMALDFGAIGKGWALDKALGVLDKGRLDAVGLDFGGQLLFWSREEKRWPSAVRGRDGTFQAPAGSLSTSAQSERRFRGPDGRLYGHILDPRTGRPAEGLGSVTVWAPSAADADALSTALFVMGPREGPAWAEREGVAAFFIDDAGRETATAAWRKTVPPR